MFKQKYYFKMKKKNSRSKLIVHEMWMLMTSWLNVGSHATFHKNSRVRCDLRLFFVSEDCFWSGSSGEWYRYSKLWENIFYKPVKKTPLKYWLSGRKIWIHRFRQLIFLCSLKKLYFFWSISAEAAETW